MSEPFQLGVLVTFVASVTGLLLTGVVQLALRSPLSRAAAQDPSTGADEASPAERRKRRA